MILTPFGTLDYNQESIGHWASAHWFRHMTYRKEMGRRGAAIMTPVLDGEIDADWFGRHALNHLALMQLTNLTDASYNLTQLEHGWDTDQHFYDWHRFHNLIHSKIDRQLQIVT